MMIRKVFLLLILLFSMNSCVVHNTWKQVKKDAVEMDSVEFYNKYEYIPIECREGGFSESKKKLMNKSSAGVMKEEKKDTLKLDTLHPNNIN